VNSDLTPTSKGHQEALVKRIIDGKGRILGKVNVIDVLVVLVLAAVVISLCSHFGDTATKRTQSVSVTFRVGEVQTATADQLEKATGTVRDDTGTVLGEIVALSSQPSIEEVPVQSEDPGQAPTIFAVESPVFQDVDITVATEATLSNGTYRVGSVTLAVGKKITLVGPGYSVEATVWAVDATE
jgi:hypothetical protein